MNNIIDKTTFCEVIELLRQQILFDRKVGENIQEAFGIHTKCSYINNLAIAATMKLLQFHFPKNEGGCKIEFYCFFMDFGDDGETIMSAEELYDTLIQDLK